MRQGRRSSKKRPRQKKKRLKGPADSDATLLAIRIAFCPKSGVIPKFLPGQREDDSPLQGQGLGLSALAPGEISVIPSGQWRLSAFFRSSYPCRFSLRRHGA